MAKKSNAAPSAPAEAAMRKQCGAKVWERGRTLAGARNLKSLMRAGDELFGRCAGSYGEPYQLHAELQNGAVADWSCSCPFEGGGWCKHLVALLLRYAKSPDDFREMPPLPEMIGALAREDLNVWLENSMRREPQLLASLAQLYNARHSTSMGAGTSGLRANLRDALSGRRATEGRVALELAVNEATRAEAAQDFAKAGEVWRVMLEELVLAVPHFEDVDDEPDYDNGWDDWKERYNEEIDVGQDWADAAVAGLERVLDAETLAPKLRDEILRSLWQCWRDAHSSDYFIMPEGAIERVIAGADAELWREVETFLLEQLGVGRPRMAYALAVRAWDDADLSNDYEREQTLDLLARGLSARGEDARATELLRQYGSYRQRLALLMGEQNWEAAEKLALQNERSYSPALLAVADDMEGAGQHERAEKLALRAREIAHRHAPPDATDWLARFYLRRGRAEDAGREAAALFVRRPDAASLELWKKSVALGDDWDDWENRYPRLEKSPDMTTPLRVRLAILDGRAARALELFRLLNDREKAGVAEDLARVCAANSPDEAIALYRQLGEAAIASRSTDNPRAVYKRVAAHWKQARDLHKQQNTMPEWIAYIRARREEHKRLRALMDELKQAGL